MRYYNTNNPEHYVTLEQAVMQGRAPDGGLFLPQDIPQLPTAFIQNMAMMSLQEISYAVANFALQGDVDSQVLKRMIDDTLCFDIPLVEVASRRYALELYHGPTMSFKDVGARFMGQLLSYFATKHNKEVTVLVATSGNSGGAVANGFYGRPGVKVVVLYPQDALDNLQEAQFATLGDNVIAIEVNGSLDDCRAMITSAFADAELRESIALTSARSINIARLLPQMFYYFYAVAQLQRRGCDVSQVVFSVPCGNLGNLTAGVMAKRMGLPIKRFIAADNANDIFTHYLATGKFEPREAVPTIASAIDIGNPRNFARIQSLYAGSYDAIVRDIQGMALSDEEISRAIKHLWRKYSYLTDPHGATALEILDRNLAPCETGVALATAHPAKYADAVENALEQMIPVPDALLQFLRGTRNVVSMNSGYASLRRFLLSK